MTTSRTHFITFLGRGRKNAAGDALVDYQPMRYRFPDGEVSAPHALFARAARGFAPGRTVAPAVRVNVRASTFIAPHRGWFRVSGG